MIQIIPRIQKQSFGEKVSEGLGHGLDMGSQIIEKTNQRRAVQDALGKDFANLPVEFQKMAFESKLKKEEQQQKLTGDSDVGMKNFNTMKEAFGEKFAKIWESSTTGAKTKLEDAAFKALERGERIENLLEGTTPPEEINQVENLDAVPQMKNDELPKDFKWPVFKNKPTGYNQKEWNEVRSGWRKENAPIFQASHTKIKNIDRDQLGIKKLIRINKSKKLPEGFERTLINPETGDFYELAKVAELPSPEAQEWVKEISRFQNRAKDAFGSRVTNFDLQTYMKQFPGLLNSEEGRTRILKMMDINSRLDKLYENALNKIYKKYGLSNIPQEEADQLASKMIEEESEKLHNEYLNIDEENLTNPPLSGKKIDVMGPDGQIYELDQSQIEQLPEGFRLI